MYTLLVDTHDKNVLIILYKNGKVISQKCLSTINKHSEIALPTIKDVLDSVMLDITELNSIIVVNGPGSFTGVRIAVTIAKTIAYCLNIPIKVIDALTVLAINVSAKEKIVAIPDRNGAFVGVYDSSNKIIDELKYINKSSYIEYKNNNIVYEDVNVDYEKVYEFAINLSNFNPHQIKPLYVKGISVLNDK